jgi:hypothetical protein
LQPFEQQELTSFSAKRHERSETRAELIDPAFQAAGWWVVEGSRIRLGIDLDMGFGGLATDQTNTAQTNTDQNIQKRPHPR